MLTGDNDINVILMAMPLIVIPMLNSSSTTMMEAIGFFHVLAKDSSGIMYIYKTVLI